MVSKVQKHGSEALGGLVNFVTGLFTESNKAAATNVVENQN